MEIRYQEFELSGIIRAHLRNITHADGSQTERIETFIDHTKDTVIVKFYVKHPVNTPKPPHSGD